MADPKAKDRMARKRQRDREQGIVGVLVRIPEHRKAEILAIAAQMLTEDYHDRSGEDE